MLDETLRAAGWGREDIAALILAREQDFIEAPIALLTNFAIAKYSSRAFSSDCATRRVTRVVLGNRTFRPAVGARSGETYDYERPPDIA